MANALEDVWNLPEVQKEYLALLELSRDIGVDVGSQFQAFEGFLKRGVDSVWRPVYFETLARIYVMYGRHALMCFAVRGRQAAVLKWAVLGTEHQQREALKEAKERTRRAFG